MDQGSRHNVFGNRRIIMLASEKYLRFPRKIRAVRRRDVLGTRTRQERRTLHSRKGDYLDVHELCSKNPDLFRQARQGYLDQKAAIALANFSVTNLKFQTLLTHWKQETGGFSLARQKQYHPTYLKIIGMGEKALPHLLREVQNRRRYFFVALEAIANENPAANTENFDDAVNAWITWGRAKRLI